MIGVVTSMLKPEPYPTGTPATIADSEPDEIFGTYLFCFVLSCPPVDPTENAEVLDCMGTEYIRRHQHVTEDNAYSDSIRHHLRC